MSGRPNRKVTNWDSEPEKHISDRLTALWLMLQYYESQLPSHIREKIQAILESADPKAEKYHWAELVEHDGEMPKGAYDDLDDDQIDLLLPLEDGSTAMALVSPDIAPETVRALTELANAATRAIRNGEFDSGFDSLGLCPKCHGAETRHGTLCLVCQNELRDDQS